MTFQSGQVPTGVALWVDVKTSAEDLVQHVPVAVTGRDGNELVITAPTYETQLAPAAGLSVVLRWNDDRGLHVCPATVLSVSGAPVTSWRVRIDGPAERVQRRDFARAPYAAPLAIVPVEDGLVSVIRGRTVDVSEGGLRARLETEVVPGTPVEVHLELESAPARLAGRILRCTLVDDDATPSYDTVVTFTVREADAVRLRRTVLRLQSTARQLRAK